MDAPNPSAPTVATATPLHIAAVGLNVRDLNRTAAYYRDVIGLDLLERTDGMARLGAGGVPLLELILRAELQPDDPRSAGLYHTAYLMPTRADLARWVMHVAEKRVPIVGASDHGVSEAFYLDDPEGNGVEVYSDRPPDTWDWSDGLVAMPTKPLDIDSIIADIDPPTVGFTGAPEGLRIGHVHLRVGDLERAEQFYSGGIGLDLTRRRHGASFMSSGHYHHHVGTNVWQSAGAGPRDPTRAGLAWFAIAASDAATFASVRGRLAAIGADTASMAEGIETADPWGTRVRLLRASGSGRLSSGA
jgi:catechol 2,3-dioxygenase